MAVMEKGLWGKIPVVVMNKYIYKEGDTAATAFADMIAKGVENRQESYLKKNPTGYLPGLEFPDGNFVGESSVIAQYFDETLDGPSLFGMTPELRAETNMWVRRIAYYLGEPLGLAYRWTPEWVQLNRDVLKVFVPENNEMVAAGLMAYFFNRAAWLDGLLANRQWVCGDRFSFADIALFCLVDCMMTLIATGLTGQLTPARFPNIFAIHSRVAIRPSAVHPDSVHDIAKLTGNRA